MRKLIERKIEKHGHSKVGKLLATDLKDLSKDKRPTPQSSNSKKGSK